MIRYILLTMTFILLGACGDVDLPEPYRLSTDDTSNDTHMLEADECMYVSWILNGGSFPGVIDTSYDFNNNIEGIQVKVGMKFELGVVPEDVRVVILNNGYFMPTVFNHDGEYEAEATIIKDTHHNPQTVLFQVYTYGWCDVPTIMPVVRW